MNTCCSTRLIVADANIDIARKVSRVLNSDDSIEVIAQVNCLNRLKVLKKELLPDLVLVGADFVRNELENTIRDIMDANPLPIAVISGDSDQEQKKALELILLGVLEVFSLSSLTKDYEGTFCERIRLLSKIKVLRHQTSLQETIKIEENGYYDGPPLLAIASSTGGPKVLAELLKSLPKKLGFSILVAQHIPGSFSKSFSSWLSSETGRKVKLAENKEFVEENTVYIAPGEKHLGLSNAGLIKLFDSTSRNVCPSADVLFSSLAAAAGRVIAVVLSGMGEDGVEGLKTLKVKGVPIIAQDLQSAVVDGMPSACVRRGLATDQLKVEDMPAKILTYILDINRRS